MKAGRSVLALVAAIGVAAAAGCGGPSKNPATATFANAPVIVISIDTLRADHLPAWGYDGVKTPNIDRLRADGVLFRNAYSQVPLTLPSHVSLLTGLLPADSGVRDNIGYRLSSNGAALPQVLKQNGYATGAAVSSYVLRGSTGLRALFDFYDDTIAFTPGVDLGGIERPGSATVVAARQWIDARAGTPFFFFLHLFEPHSPYDPPEPFRSATSLPYDGEIAHADSLVGAFLDGLRSRGIYDRAVIVLLSDHGEGLGDHGEREHGIFVYREAIHVPLIVKLPKNTAAGTTVDGPAALVDVFPTVLSVVGQKPPANLAGTPLLGAAAKQEQPRRIFSESLYGRLHLGWSDVRSLISDRQHYIDAPRPELYQFADDEREQNNVIADERRAAASFRDELARFDKKLTAPSAASSEDAAKLAALGYISAPSATLAGDLPDPKDKIQQLEQYAAANEALAGGDVQQAIAGFESLLASSPNFTDAAIGLARSYEAAGRYAEAGKVYSGLLARNPALTEQVAIGVANAFLKAGRLDDARAHAELALSSNPGGAHLLLGRIALAAHSARDAERHAREAARTPQYEVQGVMLLSEALLAAQNAPEALRVLDELKSARESRGDAPVPSLEIARAGALMRLGRTKEAMDALQAEIRLQPRNAEAYGRLAAIHLMQNDVPGAESVFSEMVRVNPAPAQYALAAKTFAYFGQNDAANRWRMRVGQGDRR